MSRCSIHGRCEHGFRNGNHETHGRHSLERTHCRLISMTPGFTFTKPAMARCFIVSNTAPLGPPASIGFPPGSKSPSAAFTENAITHSPDGTLIASCGLNRLEIRETLSGREVFRHEQDLRIPSNARYPGGSYTVPPRPENRAHRHPRPPTPGLETRKPLRDRVHSDPMPQELRIGQAFHHPRAMARFHRLRPDLVDRTTSLRLDPPDLP